MTYDLSKGDKTQQGVFYTKLSEFTAQWLQLDLPQKEPLLSKILEHRKFISTTHKPTIKEAYLEFLMLGIFINNYGGKAGKSNRMSAILLRKLWVLRMQYPQLRNRIDKIRGLLIYLLLEHSATENEITITTFRSLINWMEATGEFDNEARYLSFWEKYLSELPVSKANSILNIARLSAVSFSDMAKKILGEYTTGLSDFLNQHTDTYKYREDYFFTARAENEYYLNMFGAEIMNTEGRSAFSRTSEKVLLLPSCMRINRQGACKARKTINGVVCTNCSGNCNLGKTASVARLMGVDTYIVAHSTEYASIIKQWEHQGKTGVIGVGCALNLLGGGYLFKQLNIPSQCVPLNYAGCKKHWVSTDVSQPTSLQIPQLFRIVKSTIHTNDHVRTGT